MFGLAGGVSPQPRGVRTITAYLRNARQERMRCPQSIVRVASMIFQLARAPVRRTCLPPLCNLVRPARKEWPGFVQEWADRIQRKRRRYSLIRRIVLCDAREKRRLVGRRCNLGRCSGWLSKRRRMSRLPGHRRLARGSSTKERALRSVSLRRQAVRTDHAGEDDL
jgi:hypothetical protein